MRNAIVVAGLVLVTLSVAGGVLIAVVTLSMGNDGALVSTTAAAFAVSVLPALGGGLLVWGGRPGSSLARVLLGVAAVLVAAAAGVILKFAHLARTGPDTRWWDVHPAAAAWILAGLSAVMAAVAAIPWSTRRLATTDARAPSPTRDPG